MAAYCYCDFEPNIPTRFVYIESGDTLSAIIEHLYGDYDSCMGQQFCQDNQVAYQDNDAGPCLANDSPPPCTCSDGSTSPSCIVVGQFYLLPSSLINCANTTYSLDVSKLEGIPTCSCC